jgi:putative hydrolase of the HAD superfamily
MPNIDKLINYINKKGIRSAVISNISFSGEALKSRINSLIPDNRFEFIIASSEYVFRKPDSMIFDLALRKAHLSADEVWFCGDNSRVDIEGASSAGIFPVWFRSSLECFYVRDNNTPSCEHICISDWLELIEILEKAERKEI